jgi:hypothetical protein
MSGRGRLVAEVRDQCDSEWEAIGSVDPALQRAGGGHEVVRLNEEAP